MLDNSSPTYWEKLARRFVRGREAQSFPRPKTIPDPMVSVILNVRYGVEKDRLDQVKQEHALSMVAENAVGELLERYISDAMGGTGWVWVSGSLIKAIDFIRRKGGGFEELQIKNRDNSENSSSSAIRKGTTIKKWCRTKSKTGETMWDYFPVDADFDGDLSEEGFQRWVADYLSKLPATTNRPPRS